MKKYKIKINNNTFSFSFMDIETDYKNTYVTYDSNNINEMFYLIQLTLKNNKLISFDLNYYDTLTNTYGDWNEFDRLASKEKRIVKKIVNIMYHDYLKTLKG